MNLPEARDFISPFLAEFSGAILRAGFFGSLAKEAVAPRDCDLLIVASVHHESTTWHKLRHSIATLSRDFNSKYGIPLNVALLTEDEWQENRTMFEGLIELT